MQLGYSLGVISLAVDASGTYGAATSLDSVLRVLDLRDYSTKAVVALPPSESWSLAFAPATRAEKQLRLAVAGGSANVVRLVEVGEEPKELTTLPMPSVRCRASPACGSEGRHWCASMGNRYFRPGVQHI